MLKRWRLSYSGLWTILLVIGGIAVAAAGDELDYQQRAHRYEGIRPKPVGGFDIELLSARVDYRDSPKQLDERLHARFFLKEPAEVHIVVRELDYLHYYWLDRVKLDSPWKKGFDNVFDWPTDEVLRRLPPPRIHISDLGIVARLERATPGATEKVAPVVFYQSQFPERAAGYVFHFRVREDAKVKGELYKQGTDRPVFALDLGRQRGGRPFSFRWDAASPPAVEGDYKLVLSGYMLSTSDPVSQIVEFYHRPLIK